MEKRQKAYKRQSSIAKGLFIVLALVIIGGIIAVVTVSKTTPTSFTLSDSYNTEMSIAVEDHDTLVFYVIPTTIKKEDVELIVEDPTIAKCLIQDVYSVAEKKLVKISYLGLAVGETTLYIKDKNSDVTSDEIHLTVHEKQVEVDNSRKVYLNYTGDKYHYSASCAGSSSFESTLNQAQKLMKSPCSNCAK